MADGSRGEEEGDLSVLRLTKVYLNACAEERSRMEQFLHEIGIGAKFRRFRRGDLDDAIAGLDRSSRRDP